MSSGLRQFFGLAVVGLACSMAAPAGATEPSAAAREIRSQDALQRRALRARLAEHQARQGRRPPPTVSPASVVPVSHASPEGEPAKPEDLETKRWRLRVLTALGALLVALLAKNVFVDTDAKH